MIIILLFRSMPLCGCSCSTTSTTTALPSWTSTSQAAHPDLRNSDLGFVSLHPTPPELKKFLTFIIFDTYQPLSCLSIFLKMSLQFSFLTTEVRRVLGLSGEARLPDKAMDLLYRPTHASETSLLFPLAGAQTNTFQTPVIIRFMFRFCLPPPLPELGFLNVS